MVAGFSNVADISSKLLRFWGGDQSLGAVLTFQGQGRKPQGAASAGLIVQQIYVANSAFVNLGAPVALPLDNTIPTNTEGAAIPSLNTIITPTSATNILQIDAIVHNSSSAANVTRAATLFQDGGAAAIAVSGTVRHSTGGVPGACVLRHQQIAGLTVATTFTLRLGSNIVSTLDLNGRAGAGLYGGTLFSSMLITEISA